MNQNILSTGYDGKRWLLIDSVTQKSVKPKESVTSFRGEREVITGGRAPHKPGSTGRVWTNSGGEYYPSVFCLEWIRI